jgi:hypothetical protein
MDDYRIRVGWRGHPKRIKLERRLGAVAVLALMDLWEFCTSSRTDGDLSGMDDEDIAIAAGYTGNAAEWVAALVSIGLLVRTRSGLEVHDWKDHNPYVASHKGRSEAARAAANERWKKAKQSNDEDADACEPQCDSHDSALPNASDGNAPSPSPSPDPYPSPSAVPAASALVLDAKEPRPSRKKPKVDLPDSWCPNPAAVVRAKELRVDLGDEVERFRNHAKQEGRKCSDWDAAFRNWLLLARDKKAKTGNLFASPPPSAARRDIRE